MSNRWPRSPTAPLGRAASRWATGPPNRCSPRAITTAATAPGSRSLARSQESGGRRHRTIRSLTRPGSETSNRFSSPAPSSCAAAAQTGSRAESTQRTSTRPRSSARPTAQREQASRPTSRCTGTRRPVDEILVSLAERQNLNTNDTARLLAMVSLAGADASIAVTSEKNYWNTWRPITAIQEAAYDGNRATTSDPDWTPLIETPGFPEYPAGHKAGSCAIVGALQSFFALLDHVRVPASRSRRRAGRNLDAAGRLRRHCGGPR